MSEHVEGTGLSSCSQNQSFENRLLNNNNMTTDLLLTKIRRRLLKVLHHEWRISEFASFDYSSEFNFFDDSKNTLLNEIASQCGGSILAEDNIHFNIDDNQLTEASYISIMVWLLLAAVIVYLVDITIRKSIFKKKTKKEIQEQAPDNYF